MWISALVGMCTKYAEVTLSIKYREKNEAGDWVGVPMYYITKDLGKRWKWLASLFAAFGIGNITQINTIAAKVELLLAWEISDTLNGFMAIPNLIGVAFLSPVVINLTKEYFFELFEILIKNKHILKMFENSLNFRKEDAILY